MHLKFLTPLTPPVGKIANLRGIELLFRQLFSSADTEWSDYLSNKG